MIIAGRERPDRSICRKHHVMIGVACSHRAVGRDCSGGLGSAAQGAGMNVNFKLMHTFLLVAEHNSFCRAAEISNRSQSAISMQIRQLEAQLGVSLFHRTTRRVQLTREGELLVDCAGRAVAELQSGLRRIKEAVDIQRGRLTLACAPTVAATRMPQILAAFQKSYPCVTAHVSELTSARMLESIRRQEVDFGVGSASPNAPEFQFQPILLDKIYALIPTASDSGQETIPLAALCQLPTLVLAGSAALHGMLDKAQKAAGISLNIKYEVQQVQTLIAMAAAGLGAAILPHVAIPSEPDSRVRAVLIVDPPMVRELCVITLRGQVLSPVAVRFVEMLKRLICHPEAQWEPTTEPVVPVRAASRGRRAGAHVALAASLPS
jgi:DNA-binding transcriptional LysR family regulator